MDNIYLFQQFYIPNNNLRYNETKYCLKKNLLNEKIKKIYLLNEKIYTNSEMGLPVTNNKIEQINLGKRLMFSDVFKFVIDNNINGYIILSNSDIYYDNTLNNIYKIQLKKHRIALCQSRTELKTNLYKIKQYRGYSQDTWIYHSNNKINDLKDFDFNFGVIRCDGNMAHRLNKNKFKLYNFPNLIKCIHVHREFKRNSALRNSKIKNTKSLSVQPKYFYNKNEMKIIKNKMKKIIYIKNKLKYKQKYL